MNSEAADKIIMQAIRNVHDEELEVDKNMHLIGEDALLDSMKLVEVCLALEDAAEELGFEFDWTSEAAMSKSRSMFRTVTSLSQEFALQSKA